MLTNDEIEALLRKTQTEGYPHDVRALMHAVQAAERERLAKMIDQLWEEHAEDADEGLAEYRRGVTAGLSYAAYRVRLGA
jgi:hypothetical protein